jgi:hypothetical protein
VLEDRVLFSIAVTPDAGDWPTDVDWQIVLPPCTELSARNPAADQQVVVEGGAPPHVAQPETGETETAESPPLTSGDEPDTGDAVPCHPRDTDAPSAGADPFGLQNNPSDSASGRTESDEPQRGGTPATVAAALERAAPSRTAKSTSAASTGPHATLSSIAGTQPRMLDIGSEVDAGWASWRGMSPWGLAGRAGLDAADLPEGTPPTTPFGQNDTPDLRRRYDDYFQRLGELPAVDAGVQHTVARDDFVSFLLGHQQALPPATQTDDTTASNSLPSLATGSLPEESFASLPVLVDPPPLRLDRGNEPERANGAASQGREVAEAGIWPFGELPPRRLLRAACLVGIASGLMLRRSKTNRRHASETSLP